MVGLGHTFKREGLQGARNGGLLDPGSTEPRGPGGTALALEPAQKKDLSILRLAASRDLVSLPLWDKLRALGGAFNHECVE